MSNFLYLFRGGDESFNKLSQEEKQAHMEVWGQWMGDLREKGQLLDGLPLAADVVDRLVVDLPPPTGCC